MSQVHAKFLKGTVVVRAAVPKALQAYAKRTNAWIDFDADGFSAGHARSILATVYWWSPGKVFFQAPKTQAEVESLRALAKALEVDVDYESFGMYGVSVEASEPFFTLEIQGEDGMGYTPPQEGQGI